MSDNKDIPFDGHGAVLLPASNGSRTLTLDALSQLLQGSKLFTLRCHFDEGGPWAGTRDLFRALLPTLESEAPHLLARHDYELVHVLPDLKTSLGIRNPSLTDLASNDERVRNYPADRAMRIVHGLIDLIIELRKSAGRPPQEPWILLCIDYDHAGHITQAFLQELMRRTGSRLRLLLIPIASVNQKLDFPSVLCQELPFGVTAPEGLPRPDKTEAGRLARALELEADNDTLISTGQIPDLIRLWKVAERPDKVFEWQYKALHAFNTLGLYADAIRYGKPARAFFRSMGEGPPGMRWAIFFKLFMSYIGTNDLTSAQQIAEEDVLNDSGDASEAPMRIRLCYMMGMLHARYFPARDFATGERYLELGLTHLEQAALPESDHFFQFVFNRNGLAMIRSFQGRFQEALDLCREGYALLEKHLDPSQHRLHRSVLLYNMAQVYAQMGAFDPAIEHYSAAMRMDPNYSEYYNERGNLLLKLGHVEAAYQDYRRAIELGPPYFEVWSNLGQCCRVQGRMEDAIAAYDRSLDLQPNQPMVWVVRAQALEALGRLDEAIAAYSSALALNPILWPALAGRAVLLYEQGKLNECLADLDRAISLAPRDPDIYQNRAVALCELGRSQEAVLDLQQYLELRPDAPDRAEVEARLHELSNASVPLHLSGPAREHAATSS